MNGNDGNESDLMQNEGYALMGAAFEVYNELGPGYLEEVYQEALEIVLRENQIAFTSKPRLTVWFRGEALSKYYESDLLVAEIVVELKAVRTISPEHEAQLLNELKATRKRVGYLINFGASPRLQWSRRVL